MNSQRCLKSPVPSFSGEFLCWLGSQLPLELGALCILSETLTWALEDRRAVNIVWKTEAWKSGAAKSSDLEFCHIGDELREFINTEKSGWEYLPLAGANSRFWLEHLDIEVVQVVVSTQYSWCLCSGEQFDPSELFWQPDWKPLLQTSEWREEEYPYPFPVEMVSSHGHWWNIQPTWLVSFSFLKIDFIQFAVL